MAANVNMLVTVTALADPPPRLVILDQLLAFAELQEVRAVVVFTKPDLVEASERDRLPSLYRSLGYPDDRRQSQTRRKRRSAARTDPHAPRHAGGELRGRQELDFPCTGGPRIDRRGFAVRPGAPDHHGSQALPDRRRLSYRQSRGQRVRVGSDRRFRTDAGVSRKCAKRPSAAGLPIAAIGKNRGARSWRRWRPRRFRPPGTRAIQKSSPASPPAEGAALDTLAGG